MQVVARYGYMDIVDHGPEFVDSVIEYIAAQLSIVVDPTGEFLMQSWDQASGVPATQLQDTPHSGNARFPLALGPVVSENEVRFP